MMMKGVQVLVLDEKGKVIVEPRGLAGKVVREEL
jgi:hypothetical protein